MSPKLKVVIQYLVILAITALLIWFSLRSLTLTNGTDGTYQDKWDYLSLTWRAADKGWLIAMAVLAFISHLIRAERWRMLMDSSGHNTKLNYSFFSLMVGYLINLVIPRGGEVSRCYNLYKLDKTPVEISFGTVVVERVVDVICLVLLVGISFVVESEKLLRFIKTLPIGAGESKIKTFLYIGLAFIAVTILVLLLIKKNKKLNTFLVKTWNGFKEGLLSIFKLKKKGLFIFYSVVIWLLYFLMSYTIMLAFDQTSGLGFRAVLSLFAIGAIAMSAPLPGGTGSYHVLVPQGLIFLYQVPAADAVAFTFIFHGWQTAIMIVGGAASLLITSMIVKKKSTAG